MTEKTLQEFLEDPETLLVNAARDVDFLKIRTCAGNAVVISETEWNILREAMQTVLSAV